MVKSTELYETLQVDPTSTASDIRRAYLRLALRYHPDKHKADGETESREQVEERFKKISTAYQVLSDDVLRKAYDATGSVEDKYTGDKVQVQDLKRFKEQYVDSDDEKSDLLVIFNQVSGAFPSILEHHIMFEATVEEEQRIISIIRKLIEAGQITGKKEIEKFERGSKDKKARKKRMEKAKREEKEAEELAKELGVYEQLYARGSDGKETSASARTSDKKEAKKKTKEGRSEEDEGNLDGLKALIASKGQNRMSSLIQSLEDKYVKKKGTEKKIKGKKRKAEELEEDEDDTTQQRLDADDEEFDRIQKKLVVQKEKSEEDGGRRKKNSKSSKRTRNS